MLLVCQVFLYVRTNHSSLLLYENTKHKHIVMLFLLYGLIFSDIMKICMNYQ